MEVVVDDKKYIIKKPSYKDLTDAQIHAGKVFNQAREGKCVLRDNLSKYLRDEGLWSEEKDTELLTITLKINNIITELKKGQNGKYKKMSEARKAAIETRILRADQLALLHEQKKLDAFTAEAQAENARFDYLVYHCILDEAGNKVFSSMDDYIEKAGEPWAKKCAEELTYFLYPNIDRDWETKFPENRFLKKHGMVDAQGRLVNKGGHLVDQEFRLINEDGEWVDAEGNLVNSSGERIDEDGDIVAEYAEFENDLE